MAIEILIRRFRQGMRLPGTPNSSLPVFSKEYKTDVALHRMSNGELWVVWLKGGWWETLRPAKDTDVVEFLRAGAALAGSMGMLR